MLSMRTPLVAVLLSCGLTAASANNIEYTITDLGVFPGAPSNGGVYPNGMNGLGQAVGNADTTVSTSSGTMLAEHAFFYSGSGPLIDLGTLGGPDSYAIATSINNGGTIVGYSEATGAGNPTRAFVWTAAGGMQALPMYPGGTSTAADINNLGQIVGYATDAGGTNHSFLYTQSAGAIELNRAYGPLLINDASEVVAISGSGLNYGAYVSSGGTGAGRASVRWEGRRRTRMA